VKGLIGELLLVRDLIRNGFGRMDTVRAWQGPGRGLHDFVMGDGLAIEAKVSTSTSSSGFKVANLEQLDDEGLGCLFVCHTALVSDASGVSLPGLVAELRAILEVEPAAFSEFEQRVLMAGYVDAHRERYANLSYRSTARRFFRVVSGFPRLLRSSVPPGIKGCTYTVDVGACEQFTIEAAEVYKFIRGSLNAGGQ